MAWDSTKSTGDTLPASEWNAHVTDQKTRGVPTQENKDGSDCSGSDGDASRVLTLANTVTSDMGAEIVVVNGLVLHSADYTASHLASSSTITFTNKVWDSDKIKVIYFTQT
jgi:hypothetical protein